jgi:hypothetical protein
VNIVIANVHFHISSKDIPFLRKPYQKAYAPFISDTTFSDEGSVSIDVSLEIEDFPSTDHITRIFETTDSWSIFRNRDEYFWTDISSSLDKPTCLARFHRPIESVKVYCGKELFTEEHGMKLLMNPFSYPLDQFLLIYVLAEREGAFMHASAVDFNGEGYIFPGRSGSGKSTISQIFMLKNHRVLSDDRVVIRKIGSSFTVFGTPWSGDADIAENRSLPLRGIFFINQGDEIIIKELPPADAAERLMPVTSIPWYDEEVMSNILSFCEDLVLQIPAYALYFTPGTEVVDVLDKFVSE